MKKMTTTANEATGDRRTSSTAPSKMTTQSSARSEAAVRAQAAAKLERRAPVSPEDRRKRMAEAAYYRAERRGFAPGQEENDWLEAEQEIEGNEEREKLEPEDNNFPSPK